MLKVRLCVLSASIFFGLFMLSTLVWIAMDVRVTYKTIERERAGTRSHGSIYARLMNLGGTGQDPTLANDLFQAVKIPFFAKPKVT